MGEMPPSSSRLAPGRDLGQCQLVPHPSGGDCPLRRVDIGFQARGDGGLSLVFTLSGDLSWLKLPAPQAPGFADELWRHTCCEAFIGRVGEGAYREFNFSPSGQWAVYDFSDYRQRLDVPPPSQGPVLSLQRVSPEVLQLSALIPAALLPAPGAVLEVGLSAVIEDVAGNIAYWALSHPCEKPDFHCREAFGLILAR